ncbi:MAG: Holliday junction resolvase RuvX [Betaproteobacteria bacterium]|nr:Holliday junction resolvase RuvX [Betaproteobacteria bacterium]
MPELQHGSVLGFDFGMKRIGIAVGDIEIGLAHPLETIHSEVNAVRFARIAELLQQWKPVLAVIGLPSHDDGRAHELAPACLRFGRRVRERFGLRTVWMDERYSSHAASASLNEGGVRGRRQKVMLDQVAAQHILQHYFDEPECAHEPA